MKSLSKKIKPVSFQPNTSRIMEDVLGCKWTIVVLQSIGAGIRRPGALTKDIPGLSAKILNERLRKLLRYSVINKKTFNQIPPKVEYSLTPLGKRIMKVLKELENIESDLVQIQ